MGIARAVPFFVGELASMVEAASGWSPVLRRHFEQVGASPLAGWRGSFGERRGSANVRSACFP